MPQFPLVKKPTYGVWSKIDRDNVLKCSGKLFGDLYGKGNFTMGRKVQQVIVRLLVLSMVA